jgi:hypothetical protein
MKHRIINSLNSGFTLVELLLALTSAIVILIASATLIVSILKSSAKNRTKEILQQTKNDLSVDFSNNIRWAKQINVKNGGTGFEIDGVNYKFDGNRITKRGEDFTPSNVDITTFSVEEYATSLGIKVELESKTNPMIKDSLYLVISPRGKGVINGK